MEVTPGLDPTRITRHEVPAMLDELDIVAGWNGSVGSYYTIVTWKVQVAPDRPAGFTEYEAGYPIDSIPDLPDLAAHLAHFVDWHSPELVAVFFALLADKLRDGAVHYFADNPHGNDKIPDLIGMVLDKTFNEPVAPRPPRRRGGTTRRGQ